MTSDKVEFRVKPGASARGAARAAREAGIDVNELAFAALARVTGVSQALRAGRYAVDRGATLAQLVAKLRSGEVLRERLTVVEGLTFREMRALLAATPELRQDSRDDDGCATAAGDRRGRSAPRGPFCSRHLSLRPRQQRPGGLAPGVSLADECAAGRVGCARGRPALQDALRGADHGVDHREGNRSVGRARDDRRRVRQPAAARHAAADRPDRDLRARRPLRRQPAQARPARRRPVQHVHAGRPAADADRAAGQGRDRGRAAARQPPMRCTSSARGDGSSEFSNSLDAHNRAVDQFQRGIR